MEELKLSLSDLLKKSSKQICYIRNKRKNIVPSKAKIAGSKEQEKKSISEYKEMRGTFSRDNLLIFYSFDEMQISKDTLTLIEHKTIQDESTVEEWYFNSSVLQTAVYYAFLTENSAKEYYTAKFFRKQGHNTNYLDISKFSKINNILFFGKKKYQVTTTNTKELVNIYLKKARSTEEYFSATEWDDKWKFKEWAKLKKYITIKEIK